VIGVFLEEGALYRPAFEAHPDFGIVDDLAKAEVVCVAVPMEQRAEIVGAMIRAGKHVLAANPLAATLAECEEIARLAGEHDVLVVPAYHHRLGSALRSAVAAVRGGRIGLPWNVQCDFLVEGGEPANLPIDAVYALLGLEVWRVHAVGGRDLLTLLLDHEHDVTSTILCGRTSVPDAVHRYRISGTHGVLAVDATKPAVRVRTAQRSTGVWTGSNTVDALLDVLAAGVRTGVAELGVADAVRTQRVVDAAERSLATGRPATVEGRS
jgi:predicted dehydrogenase